MESAKKSSINGRAIPIRGDDIDTDRIIPARYLRCVTFDDLGQYAFQDERFTEDGQAKEHPFNEAAYHGSRILLAGRNFGCGSSREHAPQSLMRSGIQAFIGESFAEIFFGNCTAMGLPAVTVDHETVEKLMRIVEEDPQTELAIDLEALEIRVAGETLKCAMPEGVRRSLIAGSWDATGVLLANKEAIRKTADSIPYMSHFKTSGGLANA